MRKMVTTILRLMSPSSPYFVFYVICMEFFELAVQSSSLLSRATETDALIVCINGVVLAMNLMLLSLTLQVASSGTSIFLAIGQSVRSSFARVNIAIGYYEPRWLYRASDKVAEQKIARNGWLHALTAIFVTSGCALFAYTMLSLFIQQGECVAIVGDVAPCAYPHISPHLLVARISCADKLYVGED